MCLGFILDCAVKYTSLSHVRVRSATINVLSTRTTCKWMVAHVFKLVVLLSCFENMNRVS